MSALKKVTLINVQSHERTVLEFPETGIIRFWGDNSNGKSVFVKGLWDLVNNDISKPLYRKSIIRRNSSFCEMTYEKYDGTVMFVHVHLEAAQTYVELRRADGEVVRRYLADKSIPETVREFGLHYNADHSISANIHKDDDPFLFVSTRHKVNYDLMDTVASDRYAENTLAELERIMAESKKVRKQLEQGRLVAHATLEAIVSYNIDEESTRREKLAYISHNLRRCETRELPVLRAIPKVNVIPETGPMPLLRYPKIYTGMTAPIPDILSVYKEIETLRQGTCPLCERSFQKEVT